MAASADFESIRDTAPSAFTTTDDLSDALRRERTSHAAPPRGARRLLSAIEWGGRAPEELLRERIELLDLPGQPNPRARHLLDEL